MKIQNAVVNAGLHEAGWIQRHDHAAEYADINLAEVYDTWVVRDRIFLDVIEEIQAFIGPTAQYRSVGYARWVIQRDSLLLMFQENGHRSIEVQELTVMTISVMGERADVEKVVTFLDKTYVRERTDNHAMADWIYETNQGIRRSRIPIKEPPMPMSECYPWLPNYDQFFEKYLASPQTILFMSGPPGTGKTSILRYFLWKFKLKCTISYDEAIFEKDSCFIDFLTGNDSQILIVEDADSLLTSREDSHNSVMARFLNTSDGLIKFDNKKIVFTTNLNDFKDVDPALVRPGRCYGNIRARALTKEEAEIACKAIGRPLPPAPNRHDEYTLADLYNDPGVRMASIKMGFAA